MAFDQSARNRLQKFVNDARTLLTEEFTRQLQSIYGLAPKTGTVAELKTLTHLDNKQRQTAHVLRETLAYYLATTHGKSEMDRTKQALSRIVREQAFTVLNRLAALRMAEARGFLLESIAKSYNSKGFKLYKQLAGSAHGETGDAYRSYLYSLFDEFSLDLMVLFDRHSAQGRLFPRESTLLELLDYINHFEIKPLWSEDEIIGWIYQYFNSQEERRKMRAESRAPRNSRELAVRNQFFTPRYVVEFLTDNTLGRIWYEMTQGNTRLMDSCRYLVRRQTEVFLQPGEQVPKLSDRTTDATLNQEELLKQPVYIPYRTIKDPRCVRILDPACGSMHFGLYAFDLFEIIYEEAWHLEAEMGAEAFIREGNLNPLQQTYENFESFKTQIPRLIIEHNIHGVDIDPRAVQIAGLSLWQRAKRAWHEQGVKPQQQPTVKKSNIVCAEPMPGEKALLQEFASSLNPPVLGQFLEAIFDKMELAGEAGTLLKIEEEIQSSIHDAKDQWQIQSGNSTVEDMFQAELDELMPQKESSFDISGVDNESFWDSAEQLILNALSDYANQAESNTDQKRLFAEDAAKGFGFIDLCRKRFDVVLMNPPFGEPTGITKALIKNGFKEGGRDLGASFFQRGLCLLEKGGLCGAITNRTLSAIQSFYRWRKLVSRNYSLRNYVDLGHGVLDAMVETAMYVSGAQVDQSTDKIWTPFVNLLSSKKKEFDLIKSKGNELWRSAKDFDLVEGSPWAYWLPSDSILRFSLGKRFSDSYGDVLQGPATADDFRFYRLRWEVPKNEVHFSPTNSDCLFERHNWSPVTKGGEYALWWSDTHLVINWKHSGRELKAFISQRYHYLDGNWSWVVKNTDRLFQEGVSYPRRTTSSFCARYMPKGMSFSAVGCAIFPFDNKNIKKTLAVLNTRYSRFFMEVLLGSGDSSSSGTAARDYVASAIGGIPFENHIFDDISSSVDVLIDTYAVIESDVSSLYYCPEKLYAFNVKSISDFLKAYWKTICEYWCSAAEKYQSVELTVEKALRISDLEQDVIDKEQGKSIFSYSNCIVSIEEIEGIFSLSESDLVSRVASFLDSKRYVVKKSYFINRYVDLACHLLKAHPSSVILAALNIDPTNTIFGRKALTDLMLWLVNESFGEKPVASDKCPTKNGLNPFNTNINVEAIRSMFNNHDELCSEILSKTNKIFLENGDIIIADACRALGRAGLRDWISKDFFSAHLSTFSKSRRQAPIYWPLQTRLGTYTLWVSYHRLNEQTLYACVNDHVEPEMKTIEQDLNTLRSKAQRSIQEEKNIAKLADLESELKEFRDELLRVAKFWRPNLNDGVQITAAPLWKFFQHKAWQKKLKRTWEKLEKGDYDWAHLAYNICPERVLRKCHQDRSIAIAHDVEYAFWHEVEVPVKRGGKVTGDTKLKWQPRVLTDAELNTMIQTKIKDMKA